MINFAAVVFQRKLSLCIDIWKREKTWLESEGPITSFVEWASVCVCLMNSKSKWAGNWSSCVIPLFESVVYLQFIRVSGRQHDCGITNPKRHLKVALLKEKDLRLIPKSTQVVYQSKFWVKLLWVQIVKCVCGVEQWLQSLTHYPCIVAEYGLMPDRKKKNCEVVGEGLLPCVCVCIPWYSFMFRNQFTFTL